MNFLISYHYASKEDLTDLREVMGPEALLFLDSGAFSAASQGVPIDLSKYIEFCKETSGIYSICANLDVIGDAHATLVNQICMERSGLNPMPVFHIGEPWEYLQHYVDTYSYVGLGGLVGRHNNARIPFLDRCFKMAAEGHKKPGFHGFGCTSWELICRYPWKSVDSSSWTSGVRFNRFSLFRPELARTRASWYTCPLGGRDILKHGYLVRAYGFSTYGLVQPSRERNLVTSLSMASWYEAEKHKQKSDPEFNLFLADTQVKDIRGSLNTLRKKGYPI